MLWIEQEGRLVVWQRPSTARLMPGFWELPEADRIQGCPDGRPVGSFRHTITFHKYLFEVIETRWVNHSSDMGECQWMVLSQLETQPVSTILRKARRLVERHRTPNTARIHGYTER